MRFLVLLALTTSVARADTLEKTLAKAWADGCFTFRIDGTTYESNAKRCAQRRRPFSTFKITNALIAVDAGVLDGADAAMTWDKDKVPDECRRFFLARPVLRCALSEHDDGRAAEQRELVTRCLGLKNNAAPT